MVINKLTKKTIPARTKVVYQLLVPVLVKTYSAHYGNSSFYHFQKSQVLIRILMHIILVPHPFYLFQISFKIIITLLSCICTNTVAHICLLSLSIEHNFSSLCLSKDNTYELKY